MSSQISSKFLPACFATGIGSLPFRKAEDAVNFVHEFYHEIPFWPQLPGKNEKETMLAQFLSGVPFIEICGGVPRLTLAGDNPKLLVALKEQVYENKVSAWDSALDFFSKGGHPEGGYFKTQITGPVTLALNVTDRQGRHLFEFPKLVEWLKNFLLAKARWQVDSIQKKGWNPIIFLDEPMLARSDPSRMRSQKKYLADLLRFFVTELSKEGALVGIHVCGRTDWSLVFETGAEIVSFDAAKDIGHFLERKDLVREHFEKGHSVAWGLVPSESRGSELDPGQLVRSFLDAIRPLAFHPLSMNHILLHSLVTTSCGTAGLSLEDNRKVHEQVRNISHQLRKEALDIE